VSGRRVVAAIVATSTLAIGACTGGSNRVEDTTTSADAPGTLPDITLSDLDGNAVALSSLATQPLVLNFWYSTCPPCNAELPAFASVAAEYADRVRFVGINPEDSASTARQFAADRGVTYEQLLDKRHRSVDWFALTGFPTTVLVMKGGRITFVHRNEMTAAELRTAIRQYLGA
jgi:thiol-disulfide isomerase/thioredoxin